MANPTTNYGWPMPTSTDLVTDLPADFAAFGQPVDTSLKALNPQTTLGDIAYRSATSNINTRLGIGTNGQVLAVSGGVPAWTTTADVTPLTTKGDLFTFDTADARLGVGTNGQTLVADSTEATGLKWTTMAANGTWASWSPTWGNLTIGNGTNVARYVQNGKVVFFTIITTFGTTSSMGNGPYTSWPVAPANQNAADNASISVFLISGGGPIMGLSYVTRSTTIMPISYAHVGTYIEPYNVTSTAPFSWTTGCKLYIQGSYEVA